MPYNSTAIPPSEEITGSSSLPLARIKRILSLDPSIHACSASAAFTITLATELFIRHLTTSASRIAKADSVTSSSSSRSKSNNNTINNATTIDGTTAVVAEGGRVEKPGKRSGRRNLQYRDFANAVARIDNLEFLGDVIPKTTTYKVYKEQRAIRTAKSQLSRQVSGNIVTSETIDGDEGEGQVNGEASGDGGDGTGEEEDTMEDMEVGEGQPSSSKPPPPSKSKRKSKSLVTDTRQMTLDTKTGVPIRPLPATQDPKSLSGVPSTEQTISGIPIPLQGDEGQTARDDTINLDETMIREHQKLLDGEAQEENDDDENDIHVPAPSNPRDAAAMGRYTKDRRVPTAAAAAGGGTAESSQGTDEDVDMG